MAQAKMILLVGLQLMLARGCSMMYLESYWESWHTEDYPGDFASFLKDVPAAPEGSCAGANLVTIGVLSQKL